MRTDEAWERVERLKPAIRRVVEEYRRLGRPPVALTQMYTLRVRNDAAYRGLPAWAKVHLDGYLLGYADGLLGQPEDQDGN